MSKAKRIGTAAETAVVQYMKECGYIDTKRVVLHGSRDEGDIHINCNVDGIPDIIIEVKSRKDECTYKEVEGFMHELETECINAWGHLNDDNTLPFHQSYLVIKRHGKGKVEDWWLCWRENIKGRKVTVRCRMGDYFIKRGDSIG